MRAQTAFLTGRRSRVRRRRRLQPSAGPTEGGISFAEKDGFGSPGFPTGPTVQEGSISSDEEGGFGLVEGLAVEKGSFGFVEGPTAEEGSISSDEESGFSFVGEGRLRGVEAGD